MIPRLDPNDLAPKRGTDHANCLSWQLERLDLEGEIAMRSSITRRNPNPLEWDELQPTKAAILWNKCRDRVLPLAGKLSLAASALFASHEVLHLQIFYSL